MRDAAFILARDAVAALALLVGGVAGAAVGGVAGFYGAYCICWIISWLAGNPEYMLLMWFAMPVPPVLALSGFVGGGIFAAMGANRLMKHRRTPGFEVTSKPRSIGAEELADARGHAITTATSSNS